MRFDFSDAAYFSSLLASVFMGIIFCLIYDIRRAVHTVFEIPASVIFIFDVLTLSAFSVAVFCLILVCTKGDERFYYYFGILSGFIFCRISLSRFFFFLISSLLKVINKTMLTLKTLINRVLSAAFKILKRIFYAFLKKVQKIIKKIGKTPCNSRNSCV